MKLEKFTIQEYRILLAEEKKIRSIQPTLNQLDEIKYIRLLEYRVKLQNYLIFRNKAKYTLALENFLNKNLDLEGFKETILKIDAKVQIEFNHLEQQNIPLSSLLFESQFEEFSIFKTIIDTCLRDHFEPDFKTQYLSQQMLYENFSKLKAKFNKYF